MNEPNVTISANEYRFLIEAREKINWYAGHCFDLQARINTLESENAALRERAEKAEAAIVFSDTVLSKFDQVETIGDKYSIDFEFRYINHGEYWELTIRNNHPFEDNRTIGEEEVIGQTLREAFEKWKA